MYYYMAIVCFYLNLNKYISSKLKKVIYNIKNYFIFRKAKSKIVFCLYMF